MQPVTRWVLEAGEFARNSTKYAGMGRMRYAW